MTRTILMILIFLGILLITISITRNEVECPKERVIYKYLPRTFEEEQNEPVYVSDIFRAMFTQPSPWIGSINDIDTRKRESINKFFISQT